LKLTEQPHAPEVPSGLPSSLLERRPDIWQAEQILIAANAHIGVAKAAYFPQVTLTASGGFQSAALSDLFTGPAGLWNFAGTFTQPISAGGRIRSGVKTGSIARLSADDSTGISGVSDALVSLPQRSGVPEATGAPDPVCPGGGTALGLALPSRGDNYLEVLTNETNYFSAELGIAEARLNELQALVQLYRALGGGWQQ